MLHLAVYYMRGDWVELNKKQGVTLIQDSAKEKDPRAMRILSQLHYQGVPEAGIRQNTELGNYWLEQSAKAGHPEAQKLHKELQQAQMMMMDQAQAKKSNKLYIYLFSALIAVALLLLIFL